ncbi:hypothetical protein OIU84_003505 [Salix udensis]|uniref:Fucosyltransferase n=1 Tax=Salix udensis TaxID=889485 RepID=A0AAD6K077_9ROSI|nr:hypothetical protein OIU84_003505 [Salix udensis]
MVSDKFSGMISTIRDQTSWNKTGFQFKMQRNGYCSKIPFAFLIVFSILLMFLVVQQRSKTFEVNGGDAEINVLAGGGAAQTETPEVAGKTNIFWFILICHAWLVYEFLQDFLQIQEMFHLNKFLTNFLLPGHDKGSCLSRYESVVYRKPSSHKPSPYLLSKLRKYEILHKLCGPYTESYNKTLEQLKSGRNVISTTDCNYLVYTPLSGLGNRMLTIASAFLYALLTKPGPTGGIRK